MAEPAGSEADSSFERTMREVNQALLVSSLHQHELTEEAQRAETALRKSEAELRLQAEDVARFNRLAVGRELRIIELKKEMNRLLERLGESPCYPLDFELSASASPAAPAGTATQAAPTGASEEIAPLRAILRTEELARRPARPPDYETENGVLAALVQALADSPGEVLQLLAQKILEVLKADSAGLSLLTPDEKRFYWPAIAGMWKPHVGGGTPRDFGPCGDVLDCNSPLLFHHVERRYTYFEPVSPAVEEALLTPFHVDGKAVGTLWAVAHGDRQFDAEDLRQLQSLARFAAAAYQVTELRAFEQSRRLAALNLMEDAVESGQAMERANVELRSLEEKTQKQAESLADLNRRKDEFLAMLSHELRNPLASIRNATHLMRLQRDRNPIQVEAQGMIERQVSQLARLIDDLLEVSRISTGRIRLQLERTDWRCIVLRAVETTRPQAQHKEQVLETSLAGDPQWVHGDAARLEQVVVNLLNNAIKYTDRGGRIGVSLQQESDESILRVLDTGVGIAPEMLPHIFDLFMQVDHSLDRAQGGLGIGLALVQSLVAMHGGRVEAKSTQGQGSEFLVALPMLSSPQVDSETRLDEHPVPDHAVKVLVVDDNVDAAQSIALILQAMGHQTQLAHDGASALTAVREFVPDVVLLDIGLPVLDGYQVAQRVREEPALKDVVLIALTGYGQASDKRHSREAGFDYHLVKPVDFAEVENILAAVAAH